MKLLSRWLKSDRCWPDGCWPSESQKLLLQACLIEDEETAIKAWQGWQALTPWDYIDPGSHHLLLLLHDRLKRLNVQGPNQGRLAGVARYHWVQTELLQQQARKVLLAFESAGIDTLLLKGAALNATVYPTGLRAMGDFDVAVRRDDVHRSIDLLQQLGVTPDFEDPRKSIETKHGHTFVIPDCCQVDLHWAIFHGRPLAAEMERELWEASQPVEVGRATSRVLCPADQFLHTCEHGVRYCTVPPFRWLADACLILRSAGDDFDWERLVRQARRHEAPLPVARTLQWLQDHLEVTVPEDVISELTHGISWTNRWEYRVTARRGIPGLHTYWQTFPQHVFAWHRRGRDYPLREFHCLQHNITEEPKSRFNQFAYLLLLQSVTRAQAALPRLGSSRRFQIGTLPEERVMGFHPVEYAGRQLFRWTTRESTFVVTLPPADYQVTLRCVHARDWETDLKSALKIDFNRYPCTASSPAVGLISFDLQRSMFVDLPHQRLTIRCQSMPNLPKEEQRHLGIPLIDIKFKTMKPSGDTVSTQALQRSPSTQPREREHACVD